MDATSATTTAASSSADKDETSKQTPVKDLPRPPSDVDTMIGTRPHHFFAEKVIDAFVSGTQQALISVRPESHGEAVFPVVMRNFCVILLMFM